MTLASFSNLSQVANSLPVTIAVRCELVRGTESQLVAELLPRVKQESITLDLSETERIDAAGIAALITLYCSAIEAGNDFAVVDPSVRVLELLSLVGLDSILIADKNTSPQEKSERLRQDCRHCPAA